MTASLTDQEAEMPASASYQEALLWRLGTFRPSDRMEFERAFQSRSGIEAAFEAVTQFVVRWEEADWLEDYAIERIGKWLAKNAPAAVYDRYLDWARMENTDARLALLRGLLKKQSIN